MPFDDGYAVHYLTVSRGTPVLTSDEVEIGKVVEVRDNEREAILDGIVIEVDRRRLWVDAPEVARTAERAVTLTITAAEVHELSPPPAKGLPLRRRLKGFVRRAVRNPRQPDSPSALHNHPPPDDEDSDDEDSR